MRIEVACRSCGAVTVDAGDLHVRLLPGGFGPSADFLCPGCGTRRSYGIAWEAALRLVPHGALVIDCSLEGTSREGPALDGPALDGPAPDGPAPDGPAVDGPVLPGRRSRPRPGPLGPQHAAELRDLLATDGWLDQM